MISTRGILPLLLVFVAFTSSAAEPPAANVWSQVAPAIAGQRSDIPLGVAGPDGPLLVLGGRTSWAEYKKPRPYDVLAWDSANSTWENQFPLGKDWGPSRGLAQAPAWKDEHFHFRDVEGNTRPNWTVYGTFSLGQKYDFDPDTKKFYFFAHGKTFAYDPAKRTWADLNPPTNPTSERGGPAPSAARTETLRDRLPSASDRRSSSGGNDPGPRQTVPNPGTPSTTNGRRTAMRSHAVNQSPRNNR